MSDFEGRFADYLNESTTPSSIEVELDGQTVVLKVPTRTQLREYYAVLSDEAKYREGGDVAAFERAQWAALVGKKQAKQLLDYFDDQPFHVYKAFRQFVDDTWFGKGANEVEGK